MREFLYYFDVYGYRHDVMVRVRANEPGEARKIVQRYAQVAFGELYNRQRGVRRFLGQREEAT